MLHTKTGLQHDIAQESSKAQERAGNDFAHRTAGIVVGGGVGGIGSAAGTGGSSGGGTGGWKGGSDNRGSGRDGNGGSAFFNLVIYPGDERSQVAVLYVVGEDEPGNPRDRAREVLRGSKVIALSIDDNGVPVILLGGEARKTDCVHGLTCVVQNQREERVLRIQ